MIKALLAFLLAVFAAATFAATEVNTASPAELDAIKGIGPAIAGKIVAERNKGPFKDWNDLVTRVKGVGPKNSAEFSAAGLTVNGASLTGVAASPPAAKKGAATAAAPVPAPATAPAATTTAAPAAPMTAADRRAAKKAAKAASAAQAASAAAKK